MARPLRIELAGGLYHITARGNRREAIYLDEADRSGWLTLLGETCERYHWQCYAWCQMTNHYHLVLETAEANLGQGIWLPLSAAVKNFDKFEAEKCHARPSDGNLPQPGSLWVSLSNSMCQHAFSFGSLRTRSQ